MDRMFARWSLVVFAGSIAFFGSSQHKTAWGQMGFPPPTGVPASYQIASPREMATPREMPAPRDPSATRVAVLDVARVFKHHAAFQLGLKELRDEVDGIEQSLADQGRQMARRREALFELKASSHEHKQLEEDLTRQAADLHLQAELRRRDILKREAALYHWTYQQMRAVVENLAAEHGLSLVLRFDSEEIQGEDRGSVLKGLNRMIVTQRNLDLTDAVLHKLQTPAPRPAPAVVEVPRHIPPALQNQYRAARRSDMLTPISTDGALR